MPDKPPDEWVTIPEAAGLTGKSERTIHRYIADAACQTGVKRAG